MILGRYPDISLKDARQLRDEATAKIAKGIPLKKEEKSLQAELIVFNGYGERYITEVVAKDRSSTQWRN